MKSSTRSAGLRAGISRILDMEAACDEDATGEASDGPAGSLEDFIDDAEIEMNLTQLMAAPCGEGPSPCHVSVMLIASAECCKVPRLQREHKPNAGAS